MRSKNIEVTIKIPVPIDKPDGNGVMFDVYAIKKACENANGSPIEVEDSDGNFKPIGVASKVTFIEDGGYICVEGSVWSGGTCEQVDIIDNMVKDMTITSFGICGRNS